MEASPRAISPLRQRMLDDMRMCKLSPKTQLQYIRAVKKLTGFVGRSPDTVTVEDLRRYQLHLVDHGTSPVSINAAIAGLKFFFEVTLDRRDLISKMRPVRVPHKLPAVLSFPAVIGHQQRRGIIARLEVTYEKGSEGLLHPRVQARSVAASA